MCCQNRVRDTGHRAPADPESGKAALIASDPNTGKIRLNYQGSPSSIHYNLSRAQSSIATQRRGEHRPQSTSDSTLICVEERSPEWKAPYARVDIRHMVMTCPQWAKGRGEMLQRVKDRSFEAMMNSPADMARITQWILTRGWIEQFRLTGEVETAMKEKMK
ncbi:hypothetical protein K3495_g7591 [Podosphaera aphanis]|nr:hypothetical protein K3495_g7591 [Podosphaera aphanis]